MSTMTLSQLENNITFEGPTPDKNPEPSMPTIDRHGRHKYIRTRQCYCSHTASDECRFHSQKEAGWEKCPNEAEGVAKGRIPRQLWGLNPDFNKPLEQEVETETEAANEAVVDEVSADQVINTNQEMIFEQRSQKAA